MEKLLIVEDDPALRLLYQDEFEEEGYEVHLASSGEEAVLWSETNQVDVIILDIRLGGMDGLETMGRLLEHQSNVGVVLNSAYATFKTDFGSWSADYYVVKSSDLTELKEAVRDSLARRAA